MPRHPYCVWGTGAAKSCLRAVRTRWALGNAAPVGQCLGFWMVPLQSSFPCLPSALMSNTAWWWQSEEGGSRAFVCSLSFRKTHFYSRTRLIFTFSSLPSAISSGQNWCEENQKTREKRDEMEAGTREQAKRCWRMVKKKSSIGSERGGLQPSQPALLSACLSCIAMFGFL